MGNKSDRTCLKLGLESAGKGGSVRQHRVSNTDSIVFLLRGHRGTQSVVREFAARLRADAVLFMPFHSSFHGVSRLIPSAR
jgi:hypothetical protein